MVMGKKFAIVITQHSGQVGELRRYWRLESSNTHPQHTDGECHRAKGGVWVGIFYIPRSSPGPFSISRNSVAFFLRQC